MLAPAPLSLELTAPAVLREGEVMPLRLVARNTGDRPVVLDMGDSAFSFDFVVTGSSGGEITFTDRWDLRDNHGRPLPPVRYTLHTLLDADTVPYRMLKTQPHTFVVTPARSALSTSAPPRTTRS